MDPDPGSESAGEQFALRQRELKPHHLRLNLMSRFHRLLIILAVVVLVAVACGDDDDSTSAADPTPGTDSPIETPQAEPGAPPSLLEVLGTNEWTLVHATVDGEELALLESHPVSLRSDGAQVGGTAACNSYGSAIGTGDVLFDGFFVTEMACDPPESMQLETAYLVGLMRTITVSTEGLTLVLRGAGVEFRFDPVAPTPDAPFQGTVWTLETLIDGEAASSMIDSAPATLTFTTTEVSGSDGCNNFTGSYEIDGDAIRFGALRQTTKACEGPISRQVEHIADVIGSDPIVSIEGDSMTLTGDEDKALAYRAG